MTGSRLTPHASRDGRRRAELAKIHVLKAQLGLDDDTYRAMLWTVGRVRSAADLDFAGRRNVLDHLAAKTGKGGAGRGKGADGARPTPNELVARLAAKIRAMLRAEHRPNEYADRMARHMFGVHFWEWLTADQMHRLVGALVIDARRRQKADERAAPEVA